jgi:drug/metabolite transporter (DMT)-like permease
MELHRPSGRASLGFAFAFLTMAAWGVLPLALELVLQSLDTATITWFRFLVSALLLGLFLAQRRALPDLRDLRRSGWMLLAAATFGLAANFIAYLEGLDRTTPANAQVLIQTAPLLLSLGGILVFRERFSPGQWLGFAVLVAGLGLFFAAQLRALAGEAQRYLSGVAMLGLAPRGQPTGSPRSSSCARSAPRGSCSASTRAACSASGPLHTPRRSRTWGRCRSRCSSSAR